MHVTELQPAPGYEHVLLAEDPAAGYRGFIALHSSRLGPAVGGTRRWRYPSDEAALSDALRLARGMSYKNALAGLPMGGGKAVILADGDVASRVALFEAHGRLVESLGGRYITAEDVGTSHEDMAIVRQETRWVAGLSDPSPVTARGVSRALTAAAKHRWGSDDLSNRTVAIQGCGHVGASLAAQLSQLGARLVVCDVDGTRAQQCAAACDARVVPPDAIYDQPADIYAPCALGATLNTWTIPRLRVAIVCGAANNQLALAADAADLAAREILYVPDYVANAGGVIDGARDICGWSAERSQAAVEAMYDTVLNLLHVAVESGETPAAAADRIAEARLAP
ncbi:MAG TPA: Glu/Leu/Phe/Val dehydrogenase dimerization domain-containing protein [Gemmatimonadales bacterium]|nr:Glu/Leu/Phe/Val dehydrogenase dimerization domain-containing protein [Gemmatimonadales bacterium]